jgi:hypothetical protein
VVSIRIKDLAVSHPPPTFKRPEQQKKAPSPKSSARPQPTLFQRTLALSDGLQELRHQCPHGQRSPEANIRWLGIGGEPQVASPPPSRLEQDRTADDRSQAHEVEVLPLRNANQRAHDDPADDGEDSDLIMLDEQPKNIKFRNKKRPLPPALKGAKMAKKQKLKATEHSTMLKKQPPRSGPCGRAPPNSPVGSSTRGERLDEKQLGQPAASSSQSQPDKGRKTQRMTSKSDEQVFPATIPQVRPTPLHEKCPVVVSSPLKLGSETIIRRTQELQELREQLRQLGCRFEDNDGQIDEGAACGNVEKSGHLQADEASRQPVTGNEMIAGQELREKLRQVGCRIDDIDKVDENNLSRRAGEIRQLHASIKQVEDMLEIQRQIEERQTSEENLRPGSSPGFHNQTKVPSGDSESLFTGQECATDTQNIFTGQYESIHMEGEKPCKFQLSVTHRRQRHACVRGSTGGKSRLANA